MKAKITPEYVLIMLKELKELVNQNKFTSTKFAIKYPTYYVFQKFIYSKGLMKKVYNQEQWNSIEPNIIMATELLKLYINYGKEVKERYNNRVVHKKRQPKNTAMSLAKKIRREGESWMDVVVRANEIMREQKTQNNNTEGGALPIQAFSDVFQNNKNIESKLSNNKNEIEADLKEQIIISQERFEIIEKRFFKLNDEYKILVQKHNQLEGKFEDYRLKLQKKEQLIEKLQQQKESFETQYNHYKTVNLAEQLQNKNYKEQLQKTEKDKNKLYSNVELHIKENKERASDFEKQIKSKQDIITEKTNEIFRSESLILGLREKIEAQNEEISDLQDVLIDNKSKEIFFQKNNYSLPPFIPEATFEKNLTSQEKMGAKSLTSKNTRTFKVLGIPIFTIDNK